jgi:glycerophosphoryl diester phosphodiesterase
MPIFDLQGHRGACGHKPENSLPSFEIAFDLGVSSVETDVHLTRDGVPILIHDAFLSDHLYRLVASNDAPEAAARCPLVSALTLAQIRCYRADRNPDLRRFPCQEASPTPLAILYASHHGLDPFSPATLTDLFEFAKVYEGALGIRAGKTATQQMRVRQIRFDLELKRVPYRPETIGDEFNGTDPARLEREVVRAIHTAGMLERAQVRSFDHRAVRAVRHLEPRLTAAVLVAETAPVVPLVLVQQAQAQIYCPDFRFLDRVQVEQLHSCGIRVVPWTVNEKEDWLRLLAWDVDGITTDYPDRLAELLRERGIPF